MKTAVIFYHKNILSIYKQRWVDKCIQSIKDQTYTDFDVFELNYGHGNDILCNVFPNNKYIHYKNEFPNHIAAMNAMHDTIFANGYDVVFNTNMDDYYHPERFAKQLQAIAEGAQLVSSNFMYVQGDAYENDVSGMTFNFHTYDIITSLANGHNVVAHPVTAMHRSFWSMPNDAPGIRYNEDLLGSEDLDLWQRAMAAGRTIRILPDFLLNYRLHANQVTKTYKASPGLSKGEESNLQPSDIKPDTSTKLSMTNPKYEIRLMVVATHKYTTFLEGILDSAHKHFMANHNLVFDVFTNKVSEVKELLKDKPYFGNVNVHKVDHRPFPYPSMYRFHFFKKYQEQMKTSDYYFYVDADAIIQQEIPDVILGERVAVQHCGYVNERGTYETDPKSTSYIAPDEGTMYYGGGFWGFSKKEFWPFVHKAVEMIDTDAANGITPMWHDESVLNKYLSDNPPEKILTPSFHWPQNAPHIQAKWEAQGKNYPCIILLLHKDHEEIRK